MHYPKSTSQLTSTLNCRTRLEQLFDTSMEGAAGSLGVSTTIIKRLCRKHKIRRYVLFYFSNFHFLFISLYWIIFLILPLRWPYRRLVTLDRQIERACTVLAQKQSSQVRSEYALCQHCSRFSKIVSQTTAHCELSGMLLSHRILPYGNEFPC